MDPGSEIVVTGMGVVSPIGTGLEAFADALWSGRSGIRRIRQFDGPDVPVCLGAEVVDFDPKQYVRPRKSLKVMDREIQLGVAAADMACVHAGLHEHRVAPERIGVLFGADLMACNLEELAPTYRGCIVEGRFDFGRWWPQVASELFPLWMLKYLPNMPACHIGIAQDARGPNNTIALGEVSSVSALAEAMRVIERGQADVMIAGGASSRVHPAFLLRAAIRDAAPTEDPATVCRPFDARRRGMINGEGAAALILETRRHAQARRAPILARLLGFGLAFEPPVNGRPSTGRGLRRAIEGALSVAGIAAADIGHVNAHAAGEIAADRTEAVAIRAVLGDVPVVAPKSYFGNLGAAGGAVEIVASLLALQASRVPPTLNYEFPDPDCPVHVVCRQPLPVAKPAVLKVCHCRTGQAGALVLAAP